MNTKYYIGLDVHKDTIAIAYISSTSRLEAIYHGTSAGSSPACERALRKLAKKLNVSLQELSICYEAGPTGFVLARHLISLGVECILCSPAKTERKPNERVKTDKRDAQKLAKAHRNGDVTAVRIPPALDEAVRDLCRARTDASDDLVRAKLRLKSFLLKNGINYTGKANWSDAHMRYLRALKIPTEAQTIVLESYLRTIDEAHSRLLELKDKLIEVLESWEWKPVVKALMACKGFQEVAAMTIVSELGDIRRFPNPRKLMSFLGLTPSEHSSGTSRRQGSITKCGNSHARWILIECAQHYRKPAKLSVALSKRQDGQSPKIKALSWKMQNRLSKRYRALKARGKQENKCIVAIARELSAFIWELMVKTDLTLPQAPLHSIQPEK